MVQGSSACDDIKAVTVTLDTAVGSGDVDTCAGLVQVDVTRPDAIGKGSCLGGGDVALAGAEVTGGSVSGNGTIIASLGGDGDGEGGIGCLVADGVKFEVVQLTVCC